MKQICVIFNPAAKGERAKRFRQSLETIGAECALKPTAAPGSGRNLAAEAVQEGYTTLVAAGGDGTVNEVLNGIGDVPDGFGLVRLAVLPLGTVNVFAKEFGLPAKVGPAWETIRAGRERLIDLPCVELEQTPPPASLFRSAAPPGRPGRPPRRLFAQMAGAGFDARAVELVNWELKKRFGYLAYVVAALRALQSERSRITVRHDSETVVGEMVLFGNGRYYAGAHTIFPNAKVDDGLLEVVVFPCVTWLVALNCLWRFLRCRVPPHSGTRCFSARSVALTSPSPAPIELDGEAVGHLPATFSVLPQTLRLVVP